jgi:hypothetical protein
MTLLQGLAILLLCQSVGEAAARLLHLPLPGPVLGLLLLRVLLLRVPLEPDRSLGALSLLEMKPISNLGFGLDAMHSAWGLPRPAASLADRPRLLAWTPAQELVRWLGSLLGSSIRLQVSSRE